MAAPISQARAILGSDLLDLEDVAGALGLSPSSLPAEVRTQAEALPFAVADLEAARAGGQVLVFRLTDDAGQPLTILRLLERFPSAFDPAPLAKVGYSLRDEWGISLEPLAKTEVCKAGWHLARKAPLAESCNLSYYEQEAVLTEFAGRQAGWRRRTAVEAAFDTVLYAACRGQRLLAESFDWTSSRTVDGGYLYVGGSEPNGLTLVGYSAAVRHASLGICPTRAGA